LAIDAKAPNNLYATTFNQTTNSNGLGVYKTSDGGSNWGAVNTGLIDLNTFGIAVDPSVSGTVYVGTFSSGVFKTTNGGTSWITFNNALSNFVVGTVAVDPTASAKIYAGSLVEHAFAAKFTSAGTLTYSTFLGGSAEEVAGGIAVDSQGNAYITGATASRDFPKLGAFQSSRQGIFDAFVTKLNLAGSALSYSTYLGGTAGTSDGFAIAVDSLGSAYVTGQTTASNFPLASPFQSVNHGSNAFVTKFAPSGSSLTYSTFLGGSVVGGSQAIIGLPLEEASGIAVDANGNAWVSGFTETLDFPTLNPIRATSPCDPTSFSSCTFGSFVSEFGSTGTLLFSTYLAPSEGFINDPLAVDPQGNAYIAGTATSTRLGQPTVLGTPTAGEHAFVSKFSTTSTLADLSITLGHTPDPVTIGQDIRFTATIKNNSATTSATGVTFYPTQVPNSTIHLFKTLAPPNPANPTTTQGTCDTNEFCSIGTLAPGASATVTMVVNTFTGQEGTQTVAVGVGGNESDPTPANNVATTTVNVLGAVDLQLVATASPAPVLVGTNLTYLLVVTNTAGPSPATGVTLTDTLPAGVTFVSAGATQGTCTGTTTVVCALGTVAVAGTATVQIVVTPTVAGTITNNSTVTSNEVNSSAGKNTLRQVTDVIAPPNAANNAKLKGNYAFLFQGAEADSLMAIAGSFVADGNGNLTNGISDTNATSGLLINQSFTGTYSVGSDNRGTMIITQVGAPPQTYRFALGAFNAQGVATKARFVDFDAGRKGGAGVIEMQDPTAFSAAAIKGNFAFGVSGEDANANHFAAAGRFTADGVSLITGGLEDANSHGILNAAIAFTGTYAVASTGRGTLAFTFPGAPASNFAIYIISANEAFTISTDQRSAIVVLSSGQALRQQTANFSNAWLNGPGVFNLSGTPTGNTETDVIVGLATTDGAGNITILSDENSAGVLALNHTGATTAYSVAATGRTTFTGGTTNPVLYLVDLNRGFLVSTDVSAGVGSVEPQVGGPFSNANVAGPSFLGSLTPNALSVGPFIGEGSTDGAGNFVATEDGVTATGALFADAVFTDTFVVSPNGRLVGGSGSVSYLVSPTKAIGISAKNGKANDLVTISEGSTLASADLSITKSASVSTAVVGQQFFYNLSVKNNGPGTATGVLVTDILPSTVTFSLASTSQGVCSGPASPASPVVCSLGTIPNGAVVDISIAVTAAAAGSLPNVATVSGNEPDPLPDNNSSSFTVAISGSPDLTVLTTATPDSVILGSNLTFSVTAVNVGTVPATGVVITDTLPAGVTLVSVSAPGAAAPCTTVLPTVTCPVGGIGSGASFNVLIVVTPTATGTITNTATISANQTDPNPANNTASASATVLPAAGSSERYFLTDRNSPTVLQFDTPTDSPHATIHAGTTPHEAAISPNGRLAFVGNVNSNYVSVIDLTLDAEIARIRGVRASFHLALSGDGSKLVVPNLNSDEVDIIDTSTFQILKRVSIDGLVGDDPNNPTDIGQQGVVTAGNFAYIPTSSNTTGSALRVAVIDLTTFTASSMPGTNIGFGGARDQIAATPDGKFVVVPRRGFGASGGALLMINAATNTLSQIITAPTLTAPFAIAITRDANDPAGVFGYITQGGAARTVTVLDLRPGQATFGTLTGAQVTLPTNLNQSHIALTADGKHAIVASFLTPTAGQPANLFVLDTQLLRTSSPSAILKQFASGNALPNLDAISVGFVQVQPPANAPTITTVSPTAIVNDAPRTIHITGTNFANGAVVRVGSLDPIAATGISASSLDVTLPQFMPAQNGADIIVTNPATGGIAGQPASGILRGALTITNGPAFQPHNEVTVSAFGDNAVVIFNNVTQSITNIPTSPRPFGEAISVDGLRAYVGSFRNGGSGVDVINLNSKTLETTIPLAADTLGIGQIDAIVTAPNANPATGGPGEFLLTGYNNATTNLQDLRVVIIDSDPTSSTFNTIVGSFPAGLTTNALPGALGVPSNGGFAYANDGNTGNLIIFNIQTGAVTVVPVSALANAVAFQAHIEITPDNKSLILVSATGSLLVFDIGADPISPTLVTTITGTPPAGLQPLFFGNYRVVGNRLYAYDGTQGVVQAFNFNRAASNFSPLGSFTIPGIASAFASGLAVTPDGASLYANLDQDDSVAVIDTTQLLASSPTSLVTKFHVGLSPSAIIISPGQALVAALSVTKTATPTTVTQGTTVTFTITVTNSGPAPSTGVIFTDPLPVGLTLVSATPSQGTCNGTTTISCSLGTIAVGASASASIVAKATTLGSFTNTATASENETNPSANSSASAQITVTNTSVCPTGTTIQWTGLAAPADNQWTTPANWNPARVPVAADIVCIDTPFAGATITLASSQVTIKQLVTASSLLLNGSSATTTLTINGTTASNIASNLILNNAAINVTPGLAINGSLTSSGNSAIGGTASGLIVDGGVTINGGTLTVTGNGLVNFGPAVLGGGANLQLNPGAAFDNRSTLSIQASSISAGGAGTSLTNRLGATITVSGASTISASVTNLGTVVVQGVGAVLNLTGGYTQTSGRTLLLTPASISTNSPLAINGGVLGGTGTINGGVTVNSGGGLGAPGFSPGTISVVGPYTQTATGVYNAKIGGLTAGTQYDQITGPASGTASLGGIVNVSLIGGFVPVAGNSFMILTCNGNASCRIGTFATTNFPPLPNGLAWTITYNPTSVVLSVTTAAAGCAGGTNQWTGSGGTLLWTTPGNWSSGAIPVAADNVCIGTAFSGSTITIGSLAAANQTIASLTSSAAITFAGGPLTVTGATSFSGALNVNSGTLTLSSGGQLGVTHIAGGTLTDNGALTLSGATTLSSGTLTGSGNITASALFTWTGGILAGTATPNASFNPNAGIDFNGANANGSQHQLNQRTLNLPAGTVSLSGQSNSIVFVSGAVLHVPATTTLVFDQDGGLSNNQGLINGGGALSSVLNDGIIRKAAANTGSTTINSGIAFNMSATGRLEVLSGTISLSATGASTGGTFVVTSPGTLNFNGSYATDAATSFTGSGNYVFSSGTVTITGTYNVTGDTLISGGTFAMNATPVAINTVHLTGGSLTGTANITPSGLFTWTGGVLAGTATPNASFNPNGGIDFNGANANGSQHQLNQRTLNLPAGTVSLSGLGNSIVLVTGAVVHIPATTTLLFDQDGGLTNNQGLINGGGTLSTVLNDGIIRKAASNTGTTTIGVPFANTGTFEVLSGGVSLNATYTQTAGISRVNGGKITSTGVLTIQGGTLQGVDAPAPPTINAGISNTGGIVHPGLSPGILSTSGAFTQGANGAFNVDLNGTTPGTGFSQMNIAGPVTLGGTLNVTLGGGFTPATGNSFTILTCSSTPTCLTGTFTTTNFPTLPGGLTFTPTYNANSVALTVGTPTGADLSITKTASVTTTNLAAGSFTYTITAHNNGPTAATGVTVTDPLPASVTFVSAKPTQGTCTGTTTITCALGNLANGGTATITLSVTPNAIATAVNTTTIAANETDPNTANNSSTSTVQILGTADLSVQVSAPQSGLAGVEVGFTYTITNNGPSTATGVTLTDTLPAGLTFVRAGGTTCTGAPALTCSVLNITSGTFQAITLVVKPSAAGNFTNTANVSANESDPQPANNTAVNTFSATAAADLAASVTASPNPDGLGNPLNVSVNIINNGPSPATGVTITNPIPANTNVGAVTPSQGICAVATAITCNLGNLANGNTASVAIVLTPTLQVGTLTDTVTVAANETDPVPTNNTASASVQVQQVSDVALTETVNSPLLLGGNLTYTLTVTNNGPAVVSGPTLTDTLPPNVTFVGVNPAGGVACTPVVGNTFTCPIVGLAAGASVQFNVLVTPNATGTFTNTGSVSSGSSFDPNPANNTASATATVNAAVDLSLGVTAPQSASVGNSITFAYAIQNAGPSGATGVTFTDSLPAGLTFVSSAPPVCAGAPNLTCNLGNLAKGAAANLSIVVSVTAPGSFKNTANVSANEPDLFPSNNTAINTLTATASADIALTASALPASGAVGNNLTLTFFVKNNGPSPATGVFVAGVLSGSANIVSFTSTQGTCNNTVEFSCTFGNLASGVTASATMVFTPTAAGTLGFTASSGATEPDPVTANNSVSGSVTIVSAPTLSLSTPSLNFTSQPVGTASASQTVTLTNASPALAVTNLSIAASGDFAQTNNCHSTLPNYSSCTVSVTFAPAAYGTASGTLSILDNVDGLSYSVALTGSGTDFSIATSVPSLNVVRGSGNSLTVNFASLGGSFQNSISLSCSGIPGKISCAFSPVSVAPGAAGGSSTLTISADPSAIQTGTYTIAIVGSSGSLTHSTPLQLTIANKH